MPTKYPPHPRVRRPAASAPAALLLAALASGLALPLALRAADTGPSPRGAVRAVDAAQEDFRWRGALAAGQWVEVKGIHGPIRAEASSGREVEVVAVRRAQERGRVEDVRIQTITHDRGVTICALYPAPAGKPENRCTPGSGGQSSTEDSDVRVDFVVRVPRGVNFLGATVIGDVDARSLPGDATVSSVTGDVDVSADGVVQAGSVSGSVRAETRRADPGRDVRVTSVSGNVTLLVPDAFRARVRASTVSGNVTSDFPLTITRGRYVGASAEGQIGRGGHTLDLSTVSGAIRLRRAGGPLAGARESGTRDRRARARDEADAGAVELLTDAVTRRVVETVESVDDAEVINVVESARPVAEVAPSDFRWSGAVAAGQRVEIKGIHGGIRAEPSTGREVEVVATRRAGRIGRAESVRIETVRHEGGVTLCAVYPTPATARRPNTCTPGREWEADNQGNDVRVDFVVRIPRGVHFHGRTVNGAVQALAMPGDAFVSTVNGPVTVSAAGVVEAATVNGSIGATMGRADPGRDLAFHTVNGNITLHVPEGFRARVRASGRGGISSDFPLTVSEGRITGSSAEGQIGRGGHLLRLETFNGGVRIRRTGGAERTAAGGRHD